jgi:hypothetical protein
LEGYLISKRDGKKSKKKYLGFLFNVSEQTCSTQKHSLLCREKKLLLSPLIVIVKIFRFFKNVFVLIRLAYYELLYFAHLRVRYIHDNLYQKNRPYKKVNDYKYTRPIRRATILGFVVSFFLFQFMGSLWPGVFNPTHPKVAEGATSSATWTLDADFNSNASTTSNATTKSGVKVSGNAVTLADPTQVIENETSNTTDSLVGIHFPTSSTGYTVAQANSVVRKTTDSGATWVNKNIAGSELLFDVHFTSETVGYVV